MYCQPETPILKDGVGSLNRIETLINRCETFNHFDILDNPQVRQVTKKHFRNLIY